MELVYLWVEDYKNIKRQGFNFSPRFRCEYDDKIKELTIDENDDYIPDFFGKNINVTAIVGKNGSGKSSLLECLSDSPKFVVTFENDEFRINEDIKVINKTRYKYTKKIVNLNCMYIPSSDYFYNNINAIGEGVNIKTTFNQVFETDANNLWGYEYEITARQFDMFFSLKNYSIKKMIFPKNIIFSFEIFGYIEKYSRKYYKKDIDKLSLEDYIYMLAFFHIRAKFSSFDSLMDSFFLEKKKNKSIKDLFLENQYLIYDEEILIEYSRLKYYCSFFDRCSKIFFYKKMNDGIHQFRFFKVPTKNFTKEMFFCFNDFIDNCQFSWNMSFSSGEIAFINLLASIFHELQNGKLLLYIDEGESFLHPNWQKKYISYIVQFIKDNFPNKKIHIILTSHSPFLLSDIPKQNIIFLDKEENGNCKVVNGLKEKKQTFGANIHTLLSDSFFMEDGLMGEFAKSKIDDVINYLHDRESTIKSDNEAQKLIHIIGEPIVKNQLQRMLDSKRLKKVDKIDAIEKDIEALKAELLRLKND